MRGGMRRASLSICFSVLALGLPISAGAQEAGSTSLRSSLSARELPTAPGAVFNLGDARKLFLSALPPRPGSAYRAPVRAQLSELPADGAVRQPLGGLWAVAGPDPSLPDPTLNEIAPSATATVEPSPVEIESSTLDTGAIDDSGTSPVDEVDFGSVDDADDGDLEFDEEDLSDEDLEDLFQETEGPEDDDPLEPVNRVIFDVNLTLDRWLLRPVTRAYIETVPEPGRDGLANMLDNVASPVTLVNDILQGEMSRAGTTFGRFFINSVFGLGGFFDTAEAVGLPGHTEDFGQTLGSYGVPGSPYLVLPILGPSSPRDAVGRGVDTLFDPSNFFAPDGLQSVQTGVSLVSDRASIINETDSLEATAVDFYAAIRSFYYQNRDFEIANGRGGEAPNTPANGADGEVEEINLDLYDDLEDEDLDLVPAE